MKKLYKIIKSQAKPEKGLNMSDRLTWLLRKHILTILTWIVFMSVTYGVYSVKISRVETEIDKIQYIQTDLALTKQQLDDAKDKIKSIESDNKLTATSISEIKSEVSAINTKTDILLNILRENNNLAKK